MKHNKAIQSVLIMASARKQVQLSRLQLLSAILLQLNDPADLLAATLTSKRMRDIVQEAPLKLRISNQQLDPPNHSFLRNPSILFPGRLRKTVTIPLYQSSDPQSRICIHEGFGMEFLLSVIFHICII